MRDSLHDDREALREASRHNQGETQGGVENTAAIGQILGLASVDMQVLDTVMHNKYARNPAKLKAWLSACRVERAQRRGTKSASVNALGVQRVLGVSYLTAWRWLHKLRRAMVVSVKFSKRSGVDGGEERWFLIW